MRRDTDRWRLPLVGSAEQVPSFPDITPTIESETSSAMTQQEIILCKDPTWRPNTGDTALENVITLFGLEILFFKQLLCYRDKDCPTHLTMRKMDI